MQAGNPSIENVQPPASAPETSPEGGAERGQARGERRPRFSASLQPIKDSDFGFAQARHLLWRAGFGGTPAQVNTLVKWGPARSVDHLLNFDKVPFEPVKADAFDKDIIRPLNDEERGEIARARRAGDEEAVTRLRAARQEAERLDRGQMRDIQHWWLKRMIESPRPLEERLTLFWHGHFATNYRGIENSYHMYMQNQLFRQHAAGNFGKLLYAIIRDPAMLAYLNNNQSRKGRPNENLARELMELFSLGVGNYTEQDIKEGARALTGYTFEDDEFEFQQRNHDEGPKVILGRRGSLDGDEFVTAILEKPACAAFIAGKLYRYFVLDLPTGDKAIDGACRSVISQLQSTLSQSRYEIKPVLRRLFLSEHFYQPQVMNEQIKSPAQLVVGAMRSLNTPARDLGTLADAMALMGQNLFFPPSVKGWDGGRSWINTATMFIRQNILCFMLTGKTPAGYDPLARQEQYDPSFLLAGLDTSSATPTDADAIAEALLVHCLGRSEPHNHGVVAGVLRSGMGRGVGGGAGGGTGVSRDTLVQALLLITAMPEYQLC
jgi:uncharacterized protein (DUF1800 family)